MGCMFSKQEEASQAQFGAKAAPTGESIEGAPETAAAVAASPKSPQAADVVGAEQEQLSEATSKTATTGGDVVATAEQSIEAEEAGDTLPELKNQGRAPGDGLGTMQHSDSLKEGEHSHVLLQNSLPQVPVDVEIECQAAGLKHIGFGPLKKENQDEYYVCVQNYGGQQPASCYAVFDGHGSYGSQAAAFVCRELPSLLDERLAKHFAGATEEAEVRELLAKDTIESIISDAFVDTEAKLRTAGFNVSSSGTTASVVYQHKGQVWVASAGDSRAVTLSNPDGEWEVLPLTLDHRPGRRSEKRRVEAAGGRVEPKKLPSGKTVGEPRLWLAHIPSPGLLLSRSIGDEMATSVGCTSRPEVTYMALRPHVDQYLVVASDGVWDVLTNEQVCQLVTTADAPEAACHAILEMALVEWEERLAADNISCIVVKYVWGEVRVGACQVSTKTGDEDACEEDATAQSASPS